MSVTERARDDITLAVDDWYEWPSPVDWGSYLRLLRLRGDSSVPRMIYLDGNLLLMTPSLPHEERKERLSRLVNELVAECQIPCRPTASTTWKRRNRRGGLEGDLSYYIANEPNVRRKRTIDLRVDPPPDLAVEVVYSHDVSRAIEVYRRLGVPELWIATERKFSILGLDRPGRGRRYREVDRSVGLPFLSADEIAEWIYRDAPDGETQWLRELKAWVRDTIVPRLHVGDEAR
jgi:Uma2 family endonuclease